MKRVAIVLACMAVGYIVAAIVGYALVSGLSANTHDRSIEAAMTAVFVAGPAGALLAGIAGIMRKT